MAEKLVSTVITTYKREPDIVHRAIKSVLNQSYKNIEIIIIDDNPTVGEFSNEIKKITEAYSNVRYIKNDGNKGAQISRNNGIANAKGEFIAFLDDDDTWEKEKIEKQIKCFKDNIGIVFCNGYIVDENYEPPKKTIYNKIFKQNVTFKDMLEEDYIGTTTQFLIKKECFDKVGNFDEKFPARQDYEMCIRITKDYDAFGVDDYLFNHYIHKDEQISKNFNKSLTGYKMLYSKYKKYYDENKYAKVRIFDNMAYVCSIHNKKLYALPILMKGFLTDPKFAFKFLKKRFTGKV